MDRQEEQKDTEKKELDALCRECGHGFKVFVDRIIRSKDEKGSELNETVTCPVCGCNDCSVVHKGSS